METTQQKTDDSLTYYNKARTSLLQLVCEDLDYTYTILLIGGGCNGKSYLLKECADFLKNYNVNEELDYYDKEDFETFEENGIITSFCFNPYEKYNLEVPEHVKIIDMSMINGRDLQNM